MKTLVFDINSNGLIDDGLIVISELMVDDEVHLDNSETDLVGEVNGLMDSTDAANMSDGVLDSKDAGRLGGDAFDSVGGAENGMAAVGEAEIRTTARTHVI